MSFSFLPMKYRLQIDAECSPRDDFQNSFNGLPVKLRAPSGMHESRASRMKGAFPSIRFASPTDQRHSMSRRTRPPNRFHVQNVAEHRSVPDV